MTMINMLRGGATNGRDGRQYTQNMYPRPDYDVSQMGKNDGWENRPDSFHYNSCFNLADCWNSGAVERAKAADDTTTECALEVGDVIPLVWVPNRAIVQALTLNVLEGVAGVVLGVQSRHLLADARISTGTPATELTGVDATPLLPDGTIDQTYLDSFDCGNRIGLDEFCGCGDKQGPYTEKWLAAPLMVGGTGTGTLTNATLNAGYMLDLIIEALPAEGLDCATSCLSVSVGARVRIPRACI